MSRRSKRHLLTGKAAEARPELNELEPMATVIPSFALDNGPKAGTRRQRRQAARAARKTHEVLTDPLRRAAE